MASCSGAGEPAWAPPRRSPRMCLISAVHQAGRRSFPSRAYRSIRAVSTSSYRSRTPSQQKPPMASVAFAESPSMTCGERSSGLRRRGPLLSISQASSTSPARAILTSVSRLGFGVFLRRLTCVCDSRRACRASSRADHPRSLRIDSMRSHRVPIAQSWPERLTASSGESPHVRLTIFLVATNSLGMSETLAGRLRRARELSGLSARALSRLAGLSAAHVSLIEDARPNLEAQTAAKLARVLGVTMEWLVSGTGAEPSAARVSDAVSAASGAVVPLAADESGDHAAVAPPRSSVG